MRFLIVIFCLFVANSFAGGTAHIGDGSKIETSAIAIKDGKFEMVADARVIRIDPSAYDTIIHIYNPTCISWFYRYQHNFRNYRNQCRKSL